VIINDAIWPAVITPNPIPRLAKATLHLDYMWTEGEAYSVTILTTNALPFAVEIPVAFSTPRPDGRTFLGFTLIGLYVGVIPVYLGIFWFPALRKLSGRWMTFLLAATIGLLIFLGLDTLSEAVEQSGAIPGPFQGIGLAGIGAVTAFLLLDAIARSQAKTGRSEAEQRMTVAYLIAAGIGLHNLGEGLAIGAAFNIGEIALGTFLVVGFIIQNITEGLGIIAPVLRDRPGVARLALMGLVGGAPAILGAWLGGFAPSPTLAVFFLGVGTGAIFEVVYEITKMVQRDAERQAMPLTIFSGVAAGMLVVWVTGLLIK
jgi:zinc transporter ZupT